MISSVLPLVSDAWTLITISDRCSLQQFICYRQVRLTVIVPCAEKNLLLSSLFLNFIKSLAIAVSVLLRCQNYFFWLPPLLVAKLITIFTVNSATIFRPKC